MFRTRTSGRTLAAALRDLSEAKASVRSDAVSDLVLHAQDARDAVVTHLERALRDEAPAVRSAAAVALADVGGKEALSSLLFAVEDEDPQVRQMALLALGEIGDPRARERLRRALSDARPEVRFQAVIAFARVAKDEAIDAFLGATQDPDANIRHIALRAAEEHAAEMGTPALDEALLERARTLLVDPASSVRVVAAIVLARSRDTSGASVIRDVVAGRLKTQEVEDEAACVELAGELALEDALAPLERRAFGLARLTSETFAFQARVALARMGHPRARREILRDLSGWSRHRRTLAVAAAGRAKLTEARPLIEAMRGDEARAEQHAVEGALSDLGWS